jgi:hypothetical protein
MFLHLSQVVVLYAGKDLIVPDGYLMKLVLDLHDVFIFIFLDTC